ncbi:anion permease [Shigella flexneri]
MTTGLGKRIAYLLIGKIGNTTLGLGYVWVLLIWYWLRRRRLTPRMQAALCYRCSRQRGGGFGVRPRKIRVHVGHYLMMSIYMVAKTTGFIFFTAMATYGAESDTTTSAPAN